MMKHKRIPALGAAVLLTLSLVGCSQQSSQAEYIGIDAAKAIALEAAGVAETAASFSTAGLDRQNGMDYYAVDFTANGQSYAYNIDAVTGVIIDGGPSTGNTEVSSLPNGTAATQPGTPASSLPTNVPQTSSGGSGTAITEAQAREIALADAGFTADQVTFVRSRLDYDDGRQRYDVEFYTADYAEYDYEIDASTGEVLSYDYDAEGYTPVPAAGTTTITAEQAQQIALAEVPGATTSDIWEFEVDMDDGRLEYEGTIYYSGMEYEFTIDGYSGAIRSWEAESFRR